MSIYNTVIWGDLGVCSSGTRWLGGNILDCEAGLHWFESSLHLNIAPFFCFPQKFSKFFFYAGPLALPTASNYWISSHCLV